MEETNMKPNLKTIENMAIIEGLTDNYETLQQIRKLIEKLQQRKQEYKNQIKKYPKAKIRNIALQACIKDIDEVLGTVKKLWGL